MQRHALIVGGSGALGRSLVDAFKQSWEVSSIDYSENPEAARNVILSPENTPTQNLEFCR